MGLYPQRAVSGPSRAASWSAPARLGTPPQGTSVALSADGNTAIVGGPNDNTGAGAAWVFTRSGGVWTQQGDKLVGTGAVGSAAQGSSVALSADGHTAIVGGPNDNTNTGAAWVFTRSDGVWTQQGSKLVGTGAVGSAAQGTSVALSTRRATPPSWAGRNDNTNTGAAWVFHPQATVSGPSRAASWSAPVRLGARARLLRRAVRRRQHRHRGRVG